MPMRVIGMLQRFPQLFQCSIWLLLAFALGGELAAQGPKPPLKQAAPAGTAAPATAAHQLTAADVEAFLDGMVPIELAGEDIAGAVVVVVKDGKVLFTKGYGYSNLEKRIPVSPNTLFRPGSISKLFTWTSVMQQVERGKLDLDRDVSAYLDFKVPHTFGKPVTLRRLMTHSAGFEEVVKGIEVKKPGDLRPLSEYLRQHQPRQIYPPGTVPAYSNYGADLAGYIVQRVSGRPFSDYIEENILTPLGMRTATFRQPLPERLKPLMSEGYERASAEPRPFELGSPDPGPAGSMSLSGADIATFMIAHLQDGAYQGAQILRPETARLMHTRQFTMDPAVDGMALGFYEESRNGHRIIGHGGDLLYFHSDLHLIPDAGLGFFISYNSAGKGDQDIRAYIWEQFLNRYFPYNPPAMSAPSTAAQDLRQVVGTYVPSRRGETKLLKWLWYLLAETSVSARADGTIEVEGVKDYSGQPKRWQPVGKLAYREVDGQKLFVFQADQAGQLQIAGEPTGVLQRVAWTRSKSFLRLLLVFIVAIFTLTVVLWPVGALVRKHYGHRLELTPAQRRMRVMVKIVCALDLVFLLSFGGIVVIALKDLSVFGPGLDPWLRLLQVVGWFGVLGTVLMLYRAYAAWRPPLRGKWWSRVYHTALALAGGGFVWFVLSFNLLNFSLAY